MAGFDDVVIDCDGGVGWSRDRLLWSRDRL